MVLKNLIKVKGDQSDLIRLGPKNDGGYVVSKTALNSCNILYTYGVGWTYEFEQDFCTIYPEKSVTMYDPTIGQLNILEKNIKFFPEGLYGFESGKTSFNNHIQNNNHKNESIYLKIDTEGSEYSFFNSLNLDTLANVTGMTVEFHELNNIRNIFSFIDIMLKITTKFDIIHVHGNNHTALLKFDDGFLFPSTPEISFLRKDLNINSSFIDVKYPLLNLDYPNAKTLEDQKFEILK